MMVARGEMRAPNLGRSLHFIQVRPKLGTQLFTCQGLVQNGIGCVVWSCTILHNGLIFSEWFPHILTLRRPSICSVTVFPAANLSGGCPFPISHVPWDAPESVPSSTVTVVSRPHFIYVFVKACTPLSSPSL